MLLGRRIALRARQEADIEILHSELYDDVSAHARFDGRPWRPHPHGVASPYALREPSSNVAEFSVILRDDDSLLGNALLWHIDVHNRCAHIGLALRPACRGHGYGSEVVEVLSRYGFEVLGLHRIQIETLTDNAPMIAAAMAAGFQREGTLRDASWVEGVFMDDAVFGLLGTEWSARTTAGGKHPA